MGKRLVISLVCAAALAATMVGISLAQGTGSTAPGQVIHVVSGPQSHSEFLDFANDGLDFGDRLVSRGPLFDESRTTRVGTAHLDCVIATPVLEGGSFNCTYVLKLEDGDIMTHGIDPQGPSRVLFAVTGGTGSYRHATGQAEYIDTDVTNIIIDLDG
ncbi:MAG: hypothetical protein H0W27_07715 [Actinobacteria bacterium]|nr:hypothetical protein [Actinomycetota bacterium]